MTAPPGPPHPSWRPTPPPRGPVPLPPAPPPRPRRGTRWGLLVALVVVLGVVGLVGASCVAFLSAASQGANRPPTLGPTDTPTRALQRTVAMAERVATSSVPAGATLGPVATRVDDCPTQRGAVVVVASAEVLGLRYVEPMPYLDRDRRAVVARWAGQGYVLDRTEPLFLDESDFVEHWRTPAAAGDVPGSTATVTIVYTGTGPPAHLYLGAQSECLWPTGLPPR